MLSVLLLPAFSSIFLSFLLPLFSSIFLAFLLLLLHVFVCACVFFMESALFSVCDIFLWRVCIRLSGSSPYPDVFGHFVRLLPLHRRLSFRPLSAILAAPAAVCLIPSLSRRGYIIRPIHPAVSCGFSASGFRHQLLFGVDVTVPALYTSSSVGVPVISGRSYFVAVPVALWPLSD